MRVRRIRAVRIENGILDPTIRDAFRSPKNSQMTTIEMMTARIRVCTTEVRESMIWSAESRTMVMWRSGSFFSRVSTTFFTFRESSTSVELSSFVMDRETVGFPLYRETVETSSCPRKMSATSCR